jgi:nucleoside-diphosphate-sugar epimerase
MPPATASNISIAISGASGMVGSFLVNYLQNDYEIKALVRQSSDLKSISEARSQIWRVDFNDEAQLKHALDFVDVVIHAAGFVNPHASRQEIYAVNVDTTKRLLQASVAAGVKQFIHISSLSVLTGQEDQFNVDESAPTRYCGEAYADSKVDAEKLVEGYSNKIATTILRPGFIYGPGERAWLSKLIASLQQGNVMLVDGGSKETNVIYVGNLAKAVKASILNDTAYGQAYNLTDGQNISKKMLFDTICSELKLPRVKKRVPGFLAKGMCETVSLFYPVLPARLQNKLGRFSRAAYRLVGVNQGFSIDKAVRDLNYAQRVDFKEAMSSTLKHFGA